MRNNIILQRDLAEKITELAKETSCSSTYCHSTNISLMWLAFRKKLVSMFRRIIKAFEVQLDTKPLESQNRFSFPEVAQTCSLRLFLGQNYLRSEERSGGDGEGLG